MLVAKNSSTFRKLIKTRINTCIIAECQQSCQQKHFSSKAMSLQLSPELEQLLDSGSMKHRKHPGVQKMAPIVLPTNLVTAVDKLMCDHNEKFLFNEAGELLNLLAFRRLPLEMNEIDWRIRHRVHGDEDAVEALTKEEMMKLRSEIKHEFKRWKPIEYDYQQCLAYLVGRLAANYASTYKVFLQIKSEMPAFQPKTFFDFGSGIGSAIWAAHSTWGKSLREYFCVDASSHMNNVSQTLLTDENTGEMILKNVYYRQFLPASESVKYDLVVSAFSLLELPSAEDRVKTIDTLWRKTNDILVIIEFGNLAGFFSVLDARDYILQVENSPSDELRIYSCGAHVVMPCPHEAPCPMLKSEVRRSCGIHVSYESLFPRHCRELKKDWISYVVLRKGSRPPDSNSWPRIVKPVLKKDKHVYCRMCCPDGNLNEIIVTKSKHGRNIYRCVRQSTLGDSLPVNIEISTNSTGDEESKRSETVE